jgi:hypothetical protein
MKTCKGCKWADWNKTVSGRLHPNGAGRCTFPVKAQVLPYSIADTYRGKEVIRWLEACIASHRTIYRRDELREHCNCYAREGT